jgi:ferredoxin
MCQFCVQHGDGKRWYLEASNYAADLESDLKRRDYMIDFVRDFDTHRATAIGGMEILGRLPGPLERTGKRIFSRRMQKVHYGQPVPIEECAEIFDIATSIVKIPCICRMWAGRRADAVCVLVTTQPIEPILAEGFKDYANGPDVSDFERLTKEEAMTLLAECEEQGLMHSVWTFLTPFVGAICNCNLESGCMAMRLTVSYSMPIMWRGEWVARLDQDRCTACRRCARVCPFGALTVEAGNGEGHVSFDETRCWGCGICRSACTSGALHLVDRRTVAAVADAW